MKHDGEPEHEARPFGHEAVVGAIARHPGRDALGHVAIVPVEEPHLRIVIEHHGAITEDRRPVLVR
jgi:hypothetical protein